MNLSMHSNLCWRIRGKQIDIIRDTSAKYVQTSKMRRYLNLFDSDKTVHDREKLRNLRLC